MKFESGMVGCLIVVLAIGGSIFGTVLLSADESTYEVTKYDFKAEVTGLFDTDTSPEFFDYDLSRNYTGYYTRDSTIDGVHYWSGATFTPTGVNNYPIKYEPQRTASSSDTIYLEDAQAMTNTDPPGEGNNRYTGIQYYKIAYTTTSPTYTSTFQTYSKTLASVIQVMGLTGYDVIEIKSDLSQGYAKLLYFGTVDQFSHSVNNVNNAYYVEHEFYSSYPQDGGYEIACHSCRIDTTTNMVSFYYNDIISSSTFVRTVSLNDAVLTFSTSGLYDVYEDDVLVNSAGIPFSINQYDINVIDYMDISRGVTVTGVSA